MAHALPSPEKQVPHEVVGCNREENWMRRLPIAICLLLGASLSAHADTSVILGAGTVGGWTTSGYVANPNATAETLTVATIPFPPTSVTGTGLRPVDVPPLGSAFLTPFLTGEFTTYYVTQVESTPSAFPIVHASYQTTSAPVRSVDIPVVLVSRLTAANISTLNFGGILVEEGPICIPPAGFVPHSTLVLGNVQRTDDIPGEDLPVQLELFNADGNLVGSASLTVLYGETALIGDVVQYVGEILPLSDGCPAPVQQQLRVRRLSGGALMWGIVYTTAPDGSVTASAGVNLSP
jgi:hypothetical protein